jgi:hypothetical protein
MNEEDNSPFAEPDEFTDLPLTNEEDNDNYKDDSDTTTTTQNTPIEQPEVTATTTVATTTTVYNPDLYTSTLQHSFADKDAIKIEIVDAGKSREGQSRGYIVYTIKCNDQQVRRRYSEFESLRNALVRLFPTLVIPPIPEKHTITKYATAPTKAKEDTSIIEHRRRMLGVFLKRCLKIDCVRESSVFQSFLDPNANWGEVLSSPPLSDIPKVILQADPLDPAHSSAAHSYLPVPSTSVVFVKESEEDRKFNAVEVNARDYESVISGGVEKVNKRVMKHLADLEAELSEAGSVFNAFSLQENGELASSLEKIGQVHDNCYLSTETLVNTLNYDFSEPLGESVQFATVVKDLLKFRQQKSLQKDITARSLKHRLNYMKLLDKAEEETKRIEQALEAGQSKTGQINFDRNVAKQQEQQKIKNELNQDVTPLAPKKQSLFKIPGISKISNMIKESIESDPEVVRQANVSKTKDDINQLKQTYVAAERDLVNVTDATTEEIQKFHVTKNEELKAMILSYTSAILDWSQKNLEFWEEVKAQ